MSCRKGQVALSANTAASTAASTAGITGPVGTALSAMNYLPESELELSSQFGVSGVPLTGFRCAVGPNNDTIAMHNFACT